MSDSIVPIFNAANELAVEKISDTSKLNAGRWTLACATSVPESIRYFKLEDILHSVKYHPEQFHPDLVELVTNHLDALQK